MQTSFPYEKSFAFTVFDDTDNATISNIKPVYDLFAECGMRTTKSVWVYPSRGAFPGECLEDDAYRDYILQLRDQGFEIASHHVGDGSFTRDEILSGQEAFRKIIGGYPTVHTNHSTNPDVIYWNEKRFEWPINQIYALVSMVTNRRRFGCMGGETPTSPHFWGDICKARIRYIRNLTFNGINTLAYDPLMPYPVRRKEQFSNHWFSSSDGHTVAEFTELISERNCDALERSGGACIVYTHFASGFVSDSGRLDPTFEKRIRYLASKAGWFVPVTPLLDFLAGCHPDASDPGYLYHLSRNIRWAAQRISKWARYQR